MQLIYEIVNKGKGVIETLSPENLLLIEREEIIKTSQLVNDGANGENPFLTINDLPAPSLQNLQQVLDIGKTAQYDNGNSFVGYLTGGVNTRQWYAVLGNGQAPSNLRRTEISMNNQGFVLNSQFGLKVSDIRSDSGMPLIQYSEDSLTTQVKFQEGITTNSTLLFPKKNITGTYILATEDYIDNQITGVPINEDFLISTSTNSSLIYLTDTYRQLDISSLVGVTVQNSNEIIRIGNDLVIIGNFIDNTTTQYILTLINCRIKDNELVFDSSVAGDTGVSKIHGSKYHRGYIYGATRPDDSTVPCKIVKINPYNLNDKKIFSFSNTGSFVGGTTDIIAYKNALYVFLCPLTGNTGNLVKIDENLTTPELILTYGQTVGKRVGYASPFLIYNDEIYIPNVARTTDVYNRIGLAVFSMSGVLKRETFNQPINIAPGTIKFPIPHWMGIFNGKVLYTSAPNNFIVRFDSQSLTLEDSKSLSFSVTDDNAIYKNGDVYLAEETSGGIYKVKYSDFTTLNLEYTFPIGYSYGLLDSVVVEKESLVTKTSDIANTGENGTSKYATLVDVATKQPLDADLTAIATLSGTNGFLRTNGAGTWTVDNSIYSLDSAVVHINGIESIIGQKTFTSDVIIPFTPLNANSALSWGYAQSMLYGLNWKRSVKAATTSSLPAYTISSDFKVLTATSNGVFPTQDGITLSTGERILVKNESGSGRINNGGYIITSLGSVSTPWVLTRMPEADTSTYLESATFLVREGSIEANKTYSVNSNPVTLGTTQITFALIAGTGTYTNGTGLLLTGNSFSVDPSYIGTATQTALNSKQNTLSLTTTGTSGASTLVGSTLNIPNYTLIGLGGEPTANKQNTLAADGTGTKFPTLDAVLLGLSVKQNTLSGTGIVKSTGGTISYLTDNSTNWDNAYSNRISSLTVTGNSGSATLSANTLNIPTYTLAGLGGQSQLNGTGFVKISGTTVSYDNSTYLTSAITSLNTLTGNSQTFSTGTTGTDFNIVSSVNDHKFNIPDASALNRGLINTGTQTIAGQKSFSGLVKLTGYGATDSILGYSGSTNNIMTMSTATYPNFTEFSYLKGVTSPIQTQINNINPANKSGRSTQSGTGAATFFTINHGLTGITTANKIFVQAKTTAAGNILYADLSSTQITIYYSVAPASATNNLIWDWQII